MRQIPSARAEQAVARVPQAGEDVALVVELAVQGGGVDGDVGVGVEHGAHARGGRDEAQEANPLRAGALQRAHRRDGRPTGRQHRVEHEERAILLPRRDLEVVVHGPERVVIAIQPDVAHPRGRDELRDALDHPQPGPQDRHERQLLAGHLLAGGLFEGRLDLHGLERQVLRHLVRHEHGDLVDQLLEVARAGAPVPQDRELVPDQGVAQHGEVREGGLTHAREGTYVLRPRNGATLMKRLALVLLLAIVTTDAFAQAPARKRVAVLDFDYATVHSYVTDIWGSDVDIGKGIADMLVTELVRDGTYSVIERKQLDRVLGEQNFQQSGRADASTAARLGRLLGVDAIIIGSITQFGRDDKKLGVGAGAGGVRVGGIGLGGVGRRSAKAVVAIDARIVSIETAEILGVAQGKGESKRSGLTLAGGVAGGGGAVGGVVDMSSSNFGSTILGEATRAAVDSLLTELVAAGPKIEGTVAAISALVADVSGGELVINVGTTNGVRVGAEYPVVR